jgi:alpha-galactosidase
MGLQPDDRFRDMKGLADYIHNKGLRFGIYSTPWITSYGNRVGGSVDREDGFRYDHEGQYGRRLGVYPMHKQDAALMGQWGIDYLKYDWAPVDVPHTMAMETELRKTGRDIVFSLSNSVNFKLVGEWKKYAQVWRTTGDIIDTWGSLEDIGFSQDRWSQYAEPGNWNDPDMLILGNLGWSDKLHATRLTPNEQYTHVTQWCMLAAPLLLGCDLSNLDAFTLNLLTNHEVLAVNQDPLGKQARKIYDKDRIQVWQKQLEDGSLAIAVYNLTEIDKDVSLDLAALNLPAKVTVRDLWRQRNVGTVTGSLPKVNIPIHGCYMYKVMAAK